MVDYFSDRENDPRVRTEQVISPPVWAGLVGTVQALINSAVDCEFNRDGIEPKRLGHFASPHRLAFRRRDFHK